MGGSFAHGRKFYITDILPETFSPWLSGHCLRAAGTVRGQGNHRVSIAFLYETEFNAVFRRARALLHDDADALDVTQEVFMRAIRSIGELREGVSPATWLYRVTTNYCLNWKRDRARRHRLLAATRPSEQDPRCSPEDWFAANELLALVPDELGEVAAYYYVDEMKQEEIAALLGVSRRTIGYRLEAFRAVARSAMTDVHLEMTSQVRLAIPTPGSVDKCVPSARPTAGAESFPSISLIVRKLTTEPGGRSEGTRTATGELLLAENG
jgi:RNA polymerase sigma-70 factor, ECF subfamily